DVIVFIYFNAPRAPEDDDVDTGARKWNTYLEYFIKQQVKKVYQAKARPSHNQTDSGPLTTSFEHPVHYLPRINFRSKKLPTVS
ncbi:hypothetical protein Taro_048141, partial [Colocasia esculenta]|nr:hypothetical protein [Colocasia esculenta]